MNEKRAQIAEAVSTLTEDSSTFINFKYNPLIESLLNLDVNQVIAECLSAIRESDISLAGGATIGRVISSQLGDETADDIENMNTAFGPDGYEISDDYELVVNDLGRKEAVCQLSKVNTTAEETKAAACSIVKAANFKEVDLLKECLEKLSDVQAMYGKALRKKK